MSSLATTALNKLDGHGVGMRGGLGRLLQVVWVLLGKGLWVEKM